MTLVHTPSALAFLWSWRILSGFSYSLWSWKARAGFLKQNVCDHCLSTFIPERRNKRWICGRSERPSTHQFVLYTNAEDRRKPGRVLGSQPQGTSYHWPKFSGKRWSISCRSPSMPGGAEGHAPLVYPLSCCS